LAILSYFLLSSKDLKPLPKSISIALSASTFFILLGDNRFQMFFIVINWLYNLKFLINFLEVFFSIKLPTFFQLTNSFENFISNGDDG
jgi:hypothetical protein